MRPETLLLAAAATFPVAAVGLLCASLAEKAGADATLRCRIWTATLAAAALAPAYVAVVDAVHLVSPLALFGRESLAVLPPEVFEAASAAPTVVLPPEPSFLPVSAATPSFAFSWPLAVLLVMAGGALARLIVLAGRLAALGQLIARSRPLEDTTLERGAQRFGGAVRIGDAATPILAGWRRPVILIPEALAAQLSAQALYMICRHEWAHLERGDHRRILVEEVVLSLFWFNPLMAMIRRRLADAREEACDAAAMRDEPFAARRTYAHTLMESLKDATLPAPLLSFTGGARAAVKRRLLAIVRGPRATGAMALPAALAAILATFLAAWFVPVALAASPAADPVQPSTPRTALVRYLVPSASSPSRAARPSIAARAPALSRAPNAILPAGILSCSVDATGKVSSCVVRGQGEIGAIVPGESRVDVPVQGLLQGMGTGAAQRPGPIDYARAADRDTPLVFNCTLTPEGRAVGCSAIEPRDPERARKTIAEIEQRAWPVGEVASTSLVVTVTGTPGTLSYSRSMSSQPIVVVVHPGPMRLLLHADGRITGGGRQSATINPNAPYRTEEARLAAWAAMQAEIEKTRPTTPTPLKDESGRTVGSYRYIAGQGAHYTLDRPVALRLDGRPVGELEADANGELWFSGRRTTDRGTPIVVRDRDNVVRVRRDFRALQPGETPLFNFTPILEAPL